MANTSIFRNIASTGNADICTISCWFKRGTLGAEQALFGGWRSSTTRFQVRFQGSDNIDVEWGYSSSWYSLVTNRKFRDPSAWMHLVLAIDSTQGTPANRAKLYINGVQETSFSTENYMPQNNDTLMTTSGDEMIVGGANSSSSSGAGNHNNWFKGEQSHFQFVDGLQLAPTEFGETDATDGMWKIKTGSYATAGTNGFHLKMEDSSNLDLDSSSNGHTFTTEGTLTATKDNPSNNFCTLNFLRKSTNGTNTFSNGNTIFSNTGGTGWHQSGGTLAATAGKYYYEADINYTPGSLNSQFGWGATEMQQITQNLNQPLGKLDVSGGAVVNYAPSTGFYDTGAYMSSTTSSHDNQANSSFAGAASGDVIMIAIDLDNGKFYVGKNGTWDSTSSSNPSAGSGGKSFTTGGFLYSPWVASYNGAAVRINFGNGYFGSSAIGSAVSAGEGLWKYTPPTNYGAFCTKNINAA
jgi:hypothetical protein